MVNVLGTCKFSRLEFNKLYKAKVASWRMTKTRLAILILIGIIIIPLFGSGQEINITNASLKTTYLRGDIFEGNFSLKAINITPTYYLTSSLGHSISLRDFVRENSKQLDCESLGCADVYIANSQAFTTFKTSIKSNSTKLIGLKLSGENVEIEDINITAVLNFGEQSSPPLRMTLGETANWEFSEQSDNFTRSFVQGISSLSGTQNASIGTKSYCQELHLLDTGKILIGVNFTSSPDLNRATMELFDKSFSPIDQCEFNPKETNHCVIELEEKIGEGDYRICISSPNDSPGTSIGFKSNSASGKGYYDGSSAGGDYSIYAATPMYNATQNLEFSLIKVEEKENIVNGLNQYLFKNYKKSGSVNCSGGCYVPILFSGADQELSINNVTITYTNRGGTFQERSMYNLSKTPIRTSFEGFLDLERANFSVDFTGTKNVTFSLEGEGKKTKIITSQVNSSAISMNVKNLHPRMVPAGIQTLFIVDVISTKGIDRYDWKFEDGTSQTTTENKVLKSFNNTGTYTINISISNNNSEIVKKSFQIEVVNPRDYLNKTIEAKNIQIERIKNKTSTLDVLFKEDLRKKLNLEGLQTVVNSIDVERRTATTEEEFVKLANRLNELDVPEDIFVELRKNEPFILESEKIDLGVVGGLSGQQITNSEYKKYISNWQIANVKGNIETTKIAIIDSMGFRKTVAAIYKIRVTSEEDAYLILQNVPDLQSTASLDKLGENSKKVDLVGSQEKRLDLISFQNFDMVAYVSLDPKKIELVGEVFPCNKNGVCEKELGENSNNCRSDCKPWNRAIYIFILILILVGVAYLFIQVQFKRKYERHLFRSEEELKNLVGSIQNSIENKIPESEITEKLIKNGWSKEQIVYAIKKAKGERTRPYEIVPMDKLLDKFSSDKK